MPDLIGGAFHREDSNIVVSNRLPMAIEAKSLIQIAKLVPWICSLPCSAVIVAKDSIVQKYHLQTWHWVALYIIHTHPRHQQWNAEIS